MASEMRLIDIMRAVTKISKKVQPMLRVGCSNRELYDTILGCLAEAPTVEHTQEWFPVTEPPKKNGKYLIFTTQYFTPDHVGDPDHIDGIEISGYYAGHGFLSTNGLHAKYWTYLPAEPKPKEVAQNGNEKCCYDCISCIPSNAPIGAGNQHICINTKGEHYLETIVDPWGATCDQFVPKEVNTDGRPNEDRSC